MAVLREQQGGGEVPQRASWYQPDRTPNKVGIIIDLGYQYQSYSLEYLARLYAYLYQVPVCRMARVDKASNYYTTVVVGRIKGLGCSERQGGLGPGMGWVVLTWPQPSVECTWKICRKVFWPLFI